MFTFHLLATHHETISHTLNKNGKCYFYFVTEALRSLTLRSRRRGGSKPRGSRAAQPRPRAEGAGLRGEEGRGRGAGLWAGPRGRAYNGFPPIGLRGPFCACAAHFKLRRPLGAGVCDRRSQWARSAGRALRLPRLAAAPTGSPPRCPSRASVGPGLPRRGPGGPSVSPSPPTGCAGEAGPQHGCVGAGKCAGPPEAGGSRSWGPVCAREKPRECFEIGAVVGW